MEWWEDFFDEAYTEAWSAAGWFEDTMTLVTGVERLLALPPGAEILDVACGFGRVAGPLAQRGYRVTGLDYSADQLGLAAERNPGPRYIEADMRQPPLGPFDAVINLFSSFGYFADPSEDLAALAAWARCLRAGGVLVMELMHRDRAAHLFGTPIDHPGGSKEEGHTDWVSGVRTSTVTHNSATKTFHIRLYTVTELVEMLRRVGFSHVHALGSLDGATLTPATRLTLRAVR